MKTGYAGFCKFRRFPVVFGGHYEAYVVRVVIIPGALGTVLRGIISGNLRGHIPIWSSFFFNYIGEFLKALFDFSYFSSSECCF